MVTGIFDATWDAGLILPLIEICDNGFDDDGDGFIDDEDEDCKCCEASAPTLNGLNKKAP